MIPTRTGHPFWMHDELSAAPMALDHALAPDAADAAHRDQIAARLLKARRVYLTGCGTAYHAALAGATYLGHLTGGRVYARAIEAFELTHYEEPGPGAEDALIAFSHSGRPAETIATLARARAGGAYCLTVTGDPHSPAAQAADAVLD